jgi:flavin-dependent dehydrogenase
VTHLPPATAGAAGEAWDAVVIGAGPSGSVAACALARAGRRVMLVERSSMERGKVCGCCLSPGGVEALRRVGMEGALRGAASVTHCTVRAAGAAMRMPTAAYRVIGRGTLDARLAGLAAAAGVEVRVRSSAWVGADGRVHVRQPGDGTGDAPVMVTARAVVVADGLGGTSLVERPEFAWRVNRRSRMGVGAVLAAPPVEVPEGEVVMLCAREGYLGLVRLPTGEVDAAAAVDPGAVRAAGGPAALCARIVEGCGGDPSALGSGAWRGTPLLTRSRTAVQAGHVFVLGDAAGYVEPFTGEGMAWAMEGAVLAAGIVDDWLAGRASASSWATAHRTSLQRHHRRCGVVAGLARRAWLVRAGVGLAGRWPAVGRWAASSLGPAAEGACA